MTFWMLLRRCAPKKPAKRADADLKIHARGSHKKWLQLLAHFLSTWLPGHTDTVEEPVVEKFTLGPEAFTSVPDGEAEAHFANDDLMRTIWGHLLRCGFTTNELAFAVRELVEREQDAQQISQMHREEADSQGLGQSEARRYTAERAKWFPITDAGHPRIRIKLTDKQLAKVVERKFSEIGNMNPPDAWFALFE
ncbi:hypothetical protein EXIGLDRAFT_784352 [Exidia glandulosa HHB12029]|uniref:Uncharacterized protein n=1 Tax=Exidia glandulosa HHB12029 TaxID=1314781 RepID=A0A166MI69_EXIGL|nr:hypothetical protein EXIGLDRAFT_784352 [Exidia glandulosa HHB12029]